MEHEKEQRIAAITGLYLALGSGIPKEQLRALVEDTSIVSLASLVGGCQSLRKHWSVADHRGGLPVARDILRAITAYREATEGTGTQLIPEHADETGQRQDLLEAFAIQHGLAINRDRIAAMLSAARSVPFEDLRRGLDLLREELPHGVIPLRSQVFDAVKRASEVSRELARVGP